MPFSILGLNTALPAHSMSQQEATSLAVQTSGADGRRAAVLGKLFRRTGVKNRQTAVPHRTALEWLSMSHGSSPSDGTGSSSGPTTGERMHLYRELAAPLAEQAAAGAIASANIDPSEVSHLITVSCTGFAAPGVDVQLIRRLGLPYQTQRVNIGFMGCHGAVNGLAVARAIGNADENACVLLCAVELCSLHYSLSWGPERAVGNALFSDGAAAIVGRQIDPSGGLWKVRGTGSCLLPDSLDAMTWQVGDHGFEMSLSPRIPELIGQHLRPWLTQWLATFDLTIEQVRHWAVHPGGPRVLTAVEETLQLPPEATSASREILAQCGNMSSPTVLFILERLTRGLEANNSSRGPCVILGFGPGMVAEAALLG